MLDSAIARDLINQLSVIIRTAHIHAPGNIAVLNAVDKFISIINPALRQEKILTLEIVGEFFYLNDDRVRYNFEHLLNFDFLMREMKKRELGNITIKDIIGAEDVRAFLAAFLEAVFSKEPFETIYEIVNRDTAKIRVDKLKKIAETGTVDSKKLAKKSYFNAVSYTKGIMAKLSSGEAVSLKKSKRVIENLVDHIMEDESLLLAMTSIKSYDEYTYHHSVNVSILSITLGHRIGLRRKAITELGLAALFHDIGKSEIPKEILNKPGDFTEEEWAIIYKHPLWGVRKLLKLRGFDDTAVRASIVAFEHHLYKNLTGYPKIKMKLEQDLFSRIVAIADQYDAITSSRVYSTIPVPPNKALSIMNERAGTQLDPLLVKFFINMIGIYPIGSLVMLDTKELGLVYDSNPTLVDRPRIMIVIDSIGNKTSGYVIDLSERDKDGNFKRGIIKSLDPNAYGINLAEYLL